MKIIIDSNHFIGTDGRACLLEGEDGFIHSKSRGKVRGPLHPNGFPNIAGSLLFHGLTNVESAQCLDGIEAIAKQAADFINPRLTNAGDVVTFGQGRFSITRDHHGTYMLTNPSLDLHPHLKDRGPDGLTSIIGYFGSVWQVVLTAVERSFMGSATTLPYSQLADTLNDHAENLLADLLPESEQPKAQAAFAEGVLRSVAGCNRRFRQLDDPGVVPEGSELLQPPIRSAA